MAFRNASLKATTSLSVLYTCPSTAEAVVHALYIANVSPSNATVAVDVTVTIHNPATLEVHILNETAILHGTTLVFDKPINLRPTDFISVSAGAADSIEVNASILLSPVDATSGW
jgi:hypothetical protein